MRFFILLTALLWALPGWAEWATVHDEIRANLRSGKGEEYRLITVLPPSTRVEVIAQDSGYSHIRTGEGHEGWLPSRMLVAEGAPPAGEKIPATAPAKPAAVDEDTAELLVAQAQLVKVQADLDHERERVGNIRLLIAVIAGIAFLFGIVVGLVLREMHYRKRLHGLRV